MRYIQVLRDARKRIAMLTAYDHVMAGLLSQSGIDMIWVGMAAIGTSQTRSE
jgi:ketopantoate hydroxymethyltransferase